MGLLSRTKGRVMERAVATDLREVLPAATIRRSQQAHSAFEPDVVLEGACPVLLKRLWIECTNSKAPNIAAKLEQATSDSAKVGSSRLPILVWRRTGSKSCYATATLCVLGQLMGFVSTSQAIATIHWSELLAVFGQLATAKVAMDEVSAACRIQANVKSTTRPIPHKIQPAASLASGRAEVPKLEYVMVPEGFPAELPIGGQPWTVKYASDLLSSQEKLGVTYPLQRLIILDSTMAEGVIGDVVTHEWLHACFTACGLQIEYDLEETIVRALSPFVYSTLHAGARWW